MLDDDADLRTNADIPDFEGVFAKHHHFESVLVAVAFSKNANNKAHQIFSSRSWIADTKLVLPVPARGAYARHSAKMLLVVARCLD